MRFLLNYSRSARISKKYISEQPEPMEDVELYDLLDSNDKNFVRTLNCMVNYQFNVMPCKT